MRLFTTVGAGHKLSLVPILVREAGHAPSAHAVQVARKLLLPVVTGDLVLREEEISHSQLLVHMAMCWELWSCSPIWTIHMHYIPSSSWVVEHGITTDGASPLPLRETL